MRSRATGARQVLVGPCLALVLEGVGPPQDGRKLFASFLLQNSSSFWNGCLIRSVASLEYRGCLEPSTLLVSGSDLALEVVRSAWARRVLRPPEGYAVSRLGDFCLVSMLPVAQTQFTPLPEALCKVVSDLTADRLPATSSSIRSRLVGAFPEIQVPGDEVLHKSLGALIRERKLYHAGNGYRVVTPDTYRPPPSPPRERPMLLSNEEAIARLHGYHHQEDGRTSRAVQADEADIARCCIASDQLPWPLDRGLRATPTTKDPIKTIGTDLSQAASMKQTVLARLLKRVQLLGGARHQLVFSAQFPPLEWLEADLLRCHSVATQTKPNEAKTLEQRLAIAKMEFFSHPSVVGFGRPPRERVPSVRPPSNRNSHGTLTKRRKHHRRSSASESPKENQSRSSSSRSNEATPASESSSKKCQRLSYKPFDRPEWRRLINYGAPAHPSASPPAPPSKRNIPPDATTPPESENNALSGPERKELLPDQKYKADLCIRAGLKSLEAEERPPPGSSDGRSGSKTETEDQRHGELPRSETTPSSNKEPNSFRRHRRGNAKNDDPVLKRPPLDDGEAPLKSVEQQQQPASSRAASEIVVDNTVCVEVAVHPKAKALSTTVVTEETTVTRADGNAKVVTVTSVTTTSVSPCADEGKTDGMHCEKSSCNDLSCEKGQRDVTSSSCEVEVK